MGLRVCNETEKKRNINIHELRFTKGLWGNWPGLVLLPPPPSPHSLSSLLELSEVSTALLLAVVVKLALPVHHVGGPAVEFHFPLTLGLIYVV